MAYSNSGWSATAIATFKNWMHTKFPPNLQDPNGTGLGDGNWGTCAIKTKMAIDVLCDDQALYNEGVNYYKTDPCAGVTGYILASGQSGESGRDLGHTPLGLGHLLDAAQIAWSQGVDLFSYSSNRLLAGIEYTAKYNLGNTVPWTNFGTCGVTAYTQISSSFRGQWRPIYEIAYAYEKAIGLSFPYTKQVRDSHLEGSGPTADLFQADEPCFGTLTYYK